MILPDVLTAELLVVFSGTAVSERSDKLKAYYSASGNKFWRTLHRIKLTPRQLRPEEYELVLAYDIGLTELVKTRPGSDADLTDADYDIAGYKRRITESAPAIVAFNGKEAAKRVLGRPVEYGRQPEKLGEAAVWVLPSTADKANSYWDESHWIEIAREVRMLRKRGDRTPS